MTLYDELRQHGVPQQPDQRKGPLWRGPEVDGITFSLLSRFLVCRERFRLYAVEGLAPSDGFNHRIEYGNMWHLCKEWYVRKDDRDGLRPLWQDALHNYAKGLCLRYKNQQDQVQHWYNVCKTQFPVYVDYWRKHPDANRKPLLQEQVFNIPYKLPSGRVVRLRGKWDSVDLVNGGIWLQENKTKADIDEVRIVRQLRFDLQTMLYLVALQEQARLEGRMDHAPGPLFRDEPIVGVRYNVVRRPLAGGKYSIRQHQPTKANPLGEPLADFYERLGELIRSDPGYFFMRWNVEVTSYEILRFRRTCLDPILEQLCDWWELVAGNHDPFDTVDSRQTHGRHFLFPYGVYNPTLEGNVSDLDAYLETGSRVGLRQVDNLFPELNE